MSLSHVMELGRARECTCSKVIKPPSRMPEARPSDQLSPAGPSSDSPLCLWPETKAASDRRVCLSQACPCMSSRCIVPAPNPVSLPAPYLSLYTNTRTLPTPLSIHIQGQKTNNERQERQQAVQDKSGSRRCLLRVRQRGAGAISRTGSKERS